MLAVVAARAGSKRIPRKNFLPFGSSTLSALACDQALRIPGVDRVVFSTDAVRDAVELPAEVIWHERPDSLATDSASSQELARHLWERYGSDHRGLLWLQPTSPLRLDSDIIRCLDAWSGGAVVSVSPAGDPHPHDRFVGSDGLLSTEGTGTRVRLNGAVYVLDSDWIGREDWVSGALPVSMPSSRSLDIDTREEWDEAVMRWAERGREEGR